MIRMGGLDRWRALRARRALRAVLVGWVALAAVAAVGVLVASAAPARAEEPAAPATWKPAETADAVLHAENMAWSRLLHDALGLPEWLDLAAENRTRFELLDDPWRPGESQLQTQVPQRNRFRIGADAPHGIRFLA